MAANKNELNVPAKISASGKEVLRLRIDNGKNWFILNIDEFNDPAVWGLAIVDLAKHAAKAYSQASGGDYEKVLARIKQGFDAEWDSPTDEPKEEFEN